MICWAPICIYFPYCIQVLLCHWDKQSGDMCFPKWCPHSSFLPRCSAWLHLIQEERSLAWAHWAYKVKKAMQMKQWLPGEMATENKITASLISTGAVYSLPHFRENSEHKWPIHQDQQVQFCFKHVCTAATTLSINGERALSLNFIWY